MFRVINDYMEKVKLQSDDRIRGMFEEYLKNCSSVEKYTISVNYNRYVIDVRLKNFSVEKAAKLFDGFNSAVAYPYSALHVRFNEGKCVRYRFITCKENKEGYYCDIVIS